MQLNDSHVSRIARRHLDDSLRALAPDALPTPFMVVAGPHGMQHLGLHCLADHDFAETAATVIPSFIVFSEAVEVALAAFTADPEVCGSNPECAFIAHWGPRSRDLLASAVLRRNTQPPVIGEWLPGPAWADLGPVDDGVRSGMEMAHRIWDSDADELRQRIDDIRSAGKPTDDDVLPLTVDALREWGWLA